MCVADLKRHTIGACLFLLLFVASCSSTTHRRGMEYLPRERGLLIAEGRLNNGPAERVLFVPKGAYVAGLKSDGRYGVGTWVRVFPGKDWPADEAKPSLIVGRVAERKPQWARLEILALTDGLRHYNLLAEPYPLAKATDIPRLHAITKRLSFAQGRPKASARWVSLPLRRADGMVGSEIYAAFDLAANSKGRLGSEMAGLLRVSDFDDAETRLELVVGDIPQEAAFVLVDAFVPPPFRVDIVVYGEMRDPKVEALLKQLQTLKGELPLLGFEHIDISRQSLKKGESLSAKLGASQSVRLEVAITTESSGFKIQDQGYRLSFAPWRWILEDSERKDAKAVARRVLAQGLAMVGDNAGLAFMLENAVIQAGNVDLYASLAPSLAQAYQNLGRDDWGLEMALELLALSQKASSKDAAKLHTSLAAVASILALSGEFSKAYEAAYAQRDVLNDSYRRMLWEALSLGTWEDATSWYDKAKNMAQQLKKSGLWTEREEMLRCLGMSQVDEEACSEGLDESDTAFERAWFGSIVAAIGTEKLDYAGIHHLLGSVDSIGAPILSQLLWARLAEGAQTAEVYELYMMNAGESARKAQQYRSFLRWYRGIERSRAQSGLEPYEGPGAHTAIAWLRAFDMRSDLASICVSRAQSAKHSKGEAIELLNYASELYISIGDAENAAIVFELLAKHYESLGQGQRAKELRSRARDFASSGHGESRYKS